MRQKLNIFPRVLSDSQFVSACTYTVDNRGSLYDGPNLPATMMLLALTDPVSM
jgi:hypothetical protein